MPSSAVIRSFAISVLILTLLCNAVPNVIHCDKPDAGAIAAFTCIFPPCYGDYEGADLYAAALEIVHLEPGDKLLQIKGTSAHPTTIESSLGFFNASEFGQSHYFPNPVLYPTFPELQWDTCFTVGLQGTIVSDNMPNIALAGGGENIIDRTDIWWAPQKGVEAIADESGRIQIMQLSCDWNAEVYVQFVATIQDGEGVAHDFPLLASWNVGTCFDLTCPADIVRNAGRDVEDLLFLLESWGECEEPHFYFCRADLNCD